MNGIKTGSDSPTQFDVFLSHSSKDKPQVEWLAEQLQQHGLRPFLDKWDLRAGGSWRKDLEAALEHSKTAVVFFGPHGVGPWHDAEIDVLLDQATTRRNDFRVTSILLPGATLDAVPKFLRRLGRLDFSAQWEDPSHVQELVSFVTGSPYRDGLAALPDEPAPFRGLERFEASHAEYFFGRDGEVRDLAKRLRGSAFVAIVGASGCGKSSLARAGLQRAAAREEQADIDSWPVITVVPGADPFRSLADAVRRRADAAGLARDPFDAIKWADEQEARFLSSPDGLRKVLLSLFGNTPQPTVLLIDQFEEIFTHRSGGPDPTVPCRPEAEAFIAAMADCVRSGGGGLRVLVTLRADFVDRCSPYPVLRELFENNVLWLFEPDDNRLREAIKLPAAQRGAFFETGLVELILQDFRSQVGSLPLLEHMLLTLWKKRQGRWLTLAAYQASDGLRGALDRHANEVMSRLRSDAHRWLARQWFVYRLITPGDGVPDTRRRVPRAKLYPEGAQGRTIADEVLAHLSGPEARLVVLQRDSRQIDFDDDQADGQTQVEITHEALLHGWKQLGGWLTEARDRLRQHRRLSELAADWIAKGRQTDAAEYLLTGGRLEAAEELAKCGEIPFNKDENDYLEVSREYRRREVEKAAEEAQKESDRQKREVDVARENARRQRRLTHWALAAASVAAIAFGVAVYMKHAADKANQDKLDAANQLATKETERADAANKLAGEQQKRAEDEAAHRKQIQTRRMNEIAAALAGQALLQPPGTGDERRLLLARQALLFYRRTESSALGLVYSALRESLARPLGSLVVRGHESDVLHGVVADDRLATSSLGTIRVWDLANPLDKARVLKPTGEHQGEFFGALRLRWAAPGRRLVVRPRRRALGFADRERDLDPPETQTAAGRYPVGRYLARWDETCAGGRGRAHHPVRVLGPLREEDRSEGPGRRGIGLGILARRGGTRGRHEPGDHPSLGDRDENGGTRHVGQSRHGQAGSKGPGLQPGREGAGVWHECGSGVALGHEGQKRQPGQARFPWA
jgi:hypothetical protein